MANGIDRIHVDNMAKGPIGFGYSKDNNVSEDEYEDEINSFHKFVAKYVVGTYGYTNMMARLKEDKGSCVWDYLTIDDLINPYARAFILLQPGHHLGVTIGSYHIFSNKFMKRFNLILIFIFRFRVIFRISKTLRPFGHVIYMDSFYAVGQVPFEKKYEI